MAGKRGNGEGSVSRRPNGTWQAQAYATNPDTGERQRLTAYGETSKAARDKLREARERVEGGKPAKDSRETLGAYTQRWTTTTLAVSDRKATTKALYSTLARVHIVGRSIGGIALAALKPRDVEAWIVDLRKDGKADSTVRQAYTVLRAVLAGAERDGLVARNVAALVGRPGVKREEARFLTVEEVGKVLKAAEETRYHDVLRLLAGTGLRRGEALALRWDDVDLDGRSLFVRGTLARVGGVLTVSEPKSDRSRRAVPLSGALVAMLKAHRKAQATERLAAGEVWQDLGLVFATEVGGYVDPNNAARAMRTAVERAEIDGDGVGVHTLRHSAASAMLSAGVPLATVSRILGHSSVAITGDIYGHIAPDVSAAAAEALATALAGAL